MRLLLETIGRDIRYAARTMRKAPGFTFVAIALLALGIGINTTVFTAFEAVALRPLDVDQPERLVRVFRTSAGDRFGALSYPDYRYYRDRTSTMSDVAMLAFGMALTSSKVAAPGAASPPRVAGLLGFHLPQLLEGSARPIGTAFVSGNYFPMLGTPPAAGRLVAPSDDEPGAEPIVVLSGNFWQRHFHGDPAIVGSTIDLNGVRFTIAGVTPRDYVATAQNVPDLWAPIAAKLRLGTTSAQLADPHVLGGWVEGRMRPGVSIADVQADLDRLAPFDPTAAASLSSTRNGAPATRRGRTMTATSGRTYAPPLGAVEWGVAAATLAAVLLLLLIACTNVASLLLARAAVRRREIAVRLSLGAGRRRLMQQLLTESLLLAVAAGAAGLVLSTWMLDLSIASVAASLPEYWGTIALKTNPDARVFTYALAISVLTGIAFGLAPALQGSSGELHGALKADAGTTAGSTRRRRLLDAFAFAQIAGSLLLLVSSALLLRSSAAALHADPGFDTRRIIQLQTLDLPADAGSAARAADTMTRLDDEMARIPGVAAVARAARTPLAGARTMIRVEGLGDVPFNRITPNYFAVLGIAIVRGRTFTRDETEGDARVAVISASTAARLFGESDPIGRRLIVGDASTRLRYADREGVPPSGTLVVIGVAGDVRSLDFKKIDDAFAYLPLASGARAGATLVRVDRDAAALLPAIGVRIRRDDSRVPVLAGVLEDTIASDPRFVVSRIGGVLAGVIAIFGLVMAALGVYGMVGYGVAQRTREIGIRMALGAERRQVLRLVLREGARPVAAGVATGLLAAAAAARLLSFAIFGVRPLDPLSFGGAAAILTVIALIAIWLPARRAARVDPMVALRHE